MSRTIPERVLQAFDGQATIALPRLASVIPMDLKTLRKHRELGNLPVHIKGTGVARRHYVCTLNDVEEFFRRTGEACPSSRSEIPHITSSTSKSRVYAFPAQRNAGMNVTQRKSRKRGGPKPTGSLQITSGQDASR
ncbi:hypothetical protein ACWX0K_20580 [Nitrobacteraceae bacterium UC4446_H13]